MAWTVGSYCRVEGHEDKAFRVVPTPPGHSNPYHELPPLHHVRSVDGELDFYVYQDELSPLREDEFCECGTIGCQAGDPDPNGELLTLALVALEAEKERVQAEREAGPPIDKDSIIRRLLAGRDTDDAVEPPPADYYSKGWYVHFDWGDTGPFTDKEADYLRSLI